MRKKQPEREPTEDEMYEARLRRERLEKDAEADHFASRFAPLPDGGGEDWDTYLDNWGRLQDEKAQVAEEERKANHEEESEESPDMAKRPIKKPQAKKKPLVRPFKARPQTTAKARKARATKPMKPKADYYGPGPSKNPDLAGPLLLGPLVLPTNYDQAIKLIEELAGLNDAVLQAQKKHGDAAVVAKRLKGEWDDAAKALSDRLRQATHKANLPLFDQAERDGELKGMTENRVSPSDEKASQAGEDAPGREIDSPAGSQGVH